MSINYFRIVTDFLMHKEHAELKTKLHLSHVLWVMDVTYTSTST